MFISFSLHFHFTLKFVDFKFYDDEKTNDQSNEFSLKSNKTSLCQKKTSKNIRNYSEIRKFVIPPNSFDKKTKKNKIEDQKLKKTLF